MRRRCGGGELGIGTDVEHDDVTIIEAARELVATDLLHTGAIAEVCRRQRLEIVEMSDGDVAHRRPQLIDTRGGEPVVDAVAVAPGGHQSGGSLMVGAVGCTDLLGDDYAERLAAELFQARRDEILTLPDDLAVYPTHGAGSFCSAPSGSQRSTTIGVERATNPLLQIVDEHEFVDRLVGSMGTFPTYFRVLPERNRRGTHQYVEIPDLPRLTADGAAAHVDDGAVLVDARPIVDFALGHPAGAISNALRPVFGSWLGWMVELDTPLETGR